MEDIIKNSTLPEDEKSYWLDILPIMTDNQKYHLKEILTKEAELKQLNKDLFINWEEKL